MATLLASVDERYGAHYILLVGQYAKYKLISWSEGYDLIAHYYLECAIEMESRTTLRQELRIEWTEDYLQSALRMERAARKREREDREYALRPW